MHYFAPPILFTLTAPTQPIDARYRARNFVRESLRKGRTVHASVRADPESIAPFMREAHDFADPFTDGPEFSRRLSRMTEAVHLQAKRQLRDGYASSRFARTMREKYGTAYVVDGVPEARLRLRRLEAGEQTNRPHAHCASDFAYIHMVKDHRGSRRGHSWFGDLCARFGLGHPHYRKRETREVRQAWDAGGSVSIAHYLTDYLSASDPNVAWPWSSHQRTLSAVRGALPALSPSDDWKFAGGTVSQVARVRYGAVIDRDAGYFNASTGEVRRMPSGSKSEVPSHKKEGPSLISEGRSGRCNSVPDAATVRVAGPRDDHSAIARKPARHDSCSDSLDKERSISARRVRARWEKPSPGIVPAHGPPETIELMV